MRWFQDYMPSTRTFRCGTFGCQFSVAAVDSDRRQQFEGVQVHLLADTTFNSQDVDEVAAQHVNSDCIVHFGHSILQPRALPAHFVLPRKAAAAADIISAILLRLREEPDEERCLIVLMDLMYTHLRSDVTEALKVGCFQLASRAALRLQDRITAVRSSGPRFGRLVTA